MDAQYGIQWIQHSSDGHFFVDASQQSQTAAMLENSEVPDGAYLVDDETEHDLDQIAAENLIFMAQDGQVTEIIPTVDTDDNGAVIVTDASGRNIDCASVIQQVAAMAGQDQDDEYIEEYSDTTPQMVTEEVITDDWVQHQGEERVEIPAEQIIGSNSQVVLDIEVPLPTIQDEYTALRPYPCDFCSRRFRKKTGLMNHMIAHQNDRPNICNLCGSRFFRRADLINHLKAHADAPDPDYGEAEYLTFNEQDRLQPRNPNDHFYDQEWNAQAELIPSPENTPRKYSVVNDSIGTSEHALGRGRISRLKPKRDNFQVSSTLERPNGLSNAVTLKYEDTSQHDMSNNVGGFATSEATEKRKFYPIIDRNKPFVCQECGLAFARQKALQSHYKTHENNSAYECDQCSDVFWDASSLQEHQKSHKFEESNSEYDPDESEDTQSESESDRMYGEFYCSVCGMSFHRQDILRRHLKSHTNNVPSAVDRDQHCCNTCGETFVEALDLLAHAEVHARSPPFKCVLCGESFLDEHGIKRHLLGQHENKMTSNSCILCGKKCRNRKALIKHAWEHSREKCHPCSKCGKNFHNKARLKRHMASHRDKSVMCDVCQEEFPDGRTLSNHRHSHNTSSAGKLFPCNECGKTFGSRSSQQIHVRIHTGERPYGCRFCWKAFADGGTLRKHERIHTGEKPYVCSVCPRAFNQRVVLREHIRSHHSGLDIKRNTYHCTVCLSDMPSSKELIQHLILHSDENTAMKRQPVNGPRKYKRRRKLKPHEIERLRSKQKKNDKSSDQEVSEIDIGSVEDLLGIAEPVVRTSTRSTRSTKRNKCLTTADSNTNQLKSSAGSRYESIAEELIVEEPKKDRYNSLSSNSDKAWQTKFMNESLLSNVENTLQTIDTLVVSSNRDITVVDEVQNSKQKYNLKKASTAQRTQEVQITKTRVALSKIRKKPPKETKQSRPKMIHTEKWCITNSDGRKHHLITRTEPANMELLPSTSNMDDYEIMSPATQPPNQISSSPLHIKQEHDPHNHSVLHTSSNNDLYNAQLLLEASTLRKNEVYEKFNPSIVNDLEEILRSPLKSDKTERCRYVSESSTNYLCEQSEEEHHSLIKIEPTSPDLREIIAGSMHSDRHNGEIRLRRSSRHLLVNSNNKYPVFETDVASLSSLTNSPRTWTATNAVKNKASSILKKSCSSAKSYLSYTDDAFNSDNCGTANTSLSRSLSSISEVVSAANAAAAAASTAAVQTERKRYFECEMCSVVFSDRAQLLDHVPIHI